MYDAETIVDEVYEEEEDENPDIDYGSDEEDVIIEENSRGLTDKDIFGDISDISSDAEYESDNKSYVSRASRLKIDRKAFVSDLSMNDVKMFDTLDPDEKKYLPLNYIVSPMMEWKYIQEACASGFRSVENLSRVSNKTIRDIANISQYALDRNTAKIPKLNQAFIEYAAQRGI
jgi:hypothetical protein